MFRYECLALPDSCPRIKPTDFRRRVTPHIASTSKYFSLVIYNLVNVMYMGCSSAFFINGIRTPLFTIRSNKVLTLSSPGLECSIANTSSGIVCVYASRHSYTGTQRTCFGQSHTQLSCSLWWCYCQWVKCSRYSCRLMIVLLLPLLLCISISNMYNIFNPAIRGAVLIQFATHEKF